MRYLIDGNNVMHAARSHGAGRSIGRDVLCRLVDQWARDQEVDEVTVVFDGPVPRGDLARQIAQPGLNVLFSGSSSADAVIEEAISQADAPGRITVVTTDRAIQHAVRYRRGRCIDSQQFLTQVFQEEDEHAAPAPATPRPTNRAHGHRIRPGRRVGPARPAHGLACLAPGILRPRAEASAGGFDSWTSTCLPPVTAEL